MSSSKLCLVLKRFCNLCLWSLCLTFAHDHIMFQRVVFPCWLFFLCMLISRCFAFFLLFLALKIVCFVLWPLNASVVFVFYFTIAFACCGLLIALCFYFAMLLSDLANSNFAFSFLISSLLLSCIKETKSKEKLPSECLYTLDKCYIPCRI